MQNGAKHARGDLVGGLVDRNDAAVCKRARLLGIVAGDEFRIPDAGLEDRRCIIEFHLAVERDLQPGSKRSAR